MSTFGPAYDERQDGLRIRKQIEVIREVMLVNAWLTLADISRITGYPESSCSADLRHLRKQTFGAYRVDKRRRTSGTWEYQVRKPEPQQKVMEFAA